MSVDKIEIPIKGMDCAECVQHVQHAISELRGVESVEVILSSEKAKIRFDPVIVGLPEIKRAVKDAGYSVPDSAVISTVSTDDFNRRINVLLSVVFITVLAIVIGGEILGLFEKLNRIIPMPFGVIIVIVAGFPVFLNVIRAALKLRVISHTLMTIGVVAALAVGEWVTAAVVVVFMLVGDYVERFTTESARRALKKLVNMTPQTARMELEGKETDVQINQVKPEDVIIVRPGESIPVDGEVIFGHATIDQSAITGESIPIEAIKGSRVFAATIARFGSIKVRTIRTGRDTTFGRVIAMVEEAETHRSNVQSIADRFSGWYLPVVAGIAALTFILSHNPLSTAAVLVVACSCSIALATPVAMLASIGRSASRGLIVKGGKYLESLARADVVLVDKTGTLTLGMPQITDIIPFGTMTAAESLALAASAERYSEHPLAEAVRRAAAEQNLQLFEPQDFESLPGAGITAKINDAVVTVGTERIIEVNKNALSAVHDLEAIGKTVIFVARDKKLIAAIAFADTLRPEVPAAIEQLKAIGIRHIELITGDNERTASALAERIGVKYRASLLPEDKINIVKQYQKKGHIVVMIGDGVNDAPALAQADIGIAMGAAGSDIAIEAAHIALMREDWSLVPESFKIARRTMNVVKMNLGFTAVYNLIGLTLAAAGILPPIFAAVAQSLPDIGILTNSARLLRQK